ncbi:mitochondrial group I intron splicing factor CCM1 [Striga asiatica]|uniref:Mitochondrial group I intron splicing factor CCM1 n=1 Tax=Striga asiatica TaxID=4170 RepID=A0A5A7QFR8_STRAF|nr:mitochondrial group I intron splicing factor CCM1 [Striga asiatica]
MAVRQLIISYPSSILYHIRRAYHVISAEEIHDRFHGCRLIRPDFVRPYHKRLPENRFALCKSPQKVLVVHLRIYFASRQTISLRDRDSIDLNSVHSLPMSCLDVRLRLGLQLHSPRARRPATAVKTDALARLASRDAKIAASIDLLTEEILLG